jgi:hypothetical protein
VSPDLLGFEIRVEGPDEFGQVTITVTSSALTGRDPESVVDREDEIGDALLWAAGVLARLGLELGGEWEGVEIYGTTFMRPRSGRWIATSRPLRSGGRARMEPYGPELIFTAPLELAKKIQTELADWLRRIGENDATSTADIRARWRVEEIERLAREAAQRAAMGWPAPQQAPEVDA